MNNAGTRKPLLREPIHPRPVEAAALASSPKRLEPAVRNLRPEHVERLDVGRHAVVRVMSAQHSTQPFTLAPPAGAVNPPSFTGTVTVSDLNSGVLCSSVALVNGAASCSPSSPVVPPDTIHVNFMNDTVYAPASASITVTSSGYSVSVLPFLAYAANSNSEVVGVRCSNGSRPMQSTGITQRLGEMLSYSDRAAA
jgi:hypothetical protein